MILNEHFLNLSDTDAAALIEKRISDFQFANPDTVILRLDTEDAPLPFADCVAQAMAQAMEQVKEDPSLRGVPPINGYPFLIQAVKDYYQARQIPLFDTEIFINDGAKCDISGVLDLLAKDNTALITEPFNPLYYNANLAAGRVIRFLPAEEEHGFLSRPDDGDADIIYLCSPNNPTGAVYTRELLEKWVSFALERGALILFDASYEAFITDERYPRSIYQIEGARKCAIEICSLSKAAGFANSRLGYTVIPNNLIVDNTRLNQLWIRRQRLRFNGVSYIVQKGAQAAFSPKGQQAVQAQAAYYRDNAQLLTDALAKARLCAPTVCQSPNVWMKCPQGMSSWECFHYLLEKLGIAAIPGSIFGSYGENHMTLTGYATRENVRAAAGRLETLASQQGETT